MTLHRLTLGLAAAAHTLVACHFAAAQEDWPIIAARGDQLFEGDQPFRFISFNVPNLQLVEDDFSTHAATPWAWPTDFEIADALESVRQMGGAVVRTYVLSVRRQESDMGDHFYVQGPGQFNEEAFRRLDRVLEIAREKRVRVFVPFVDNWSWQGGRAEYAAFRGKSSDEFWTDEQIIADFEMTVRFVLNRVNTRTGVAYKDDPTIFGWETGNELDCPPAWTRRIAALIKSIDAKHLVIDGNSLHGVPVESLEDQNVDVITTHHYPGENTDFVRVIRTAREATKGKKPYFVGEFGFIPTDHIEETLDAVIREGACGALLWSLRFHHRGGGYYWHSEPSGGGIFKAYHWPGFESGDAYDEREVLALVRRKAFEIRGREPERRAAPKAPTLLPIEHVGAISWQGSAGANSYELQRARNPIGPWETVAWQVDDSALQYVPLYGDASAEIGETYSYRVLARNAEGESPPSNVQSLRIDSQMLVDECRDKSLLNDSSEQVEPTTGDDRKRYEDVHRLRMPADSAVVYRADGPIDAVEVVLFVTEPSLPVSLEGSSGGDVFSAVEASVEATEEAADDYGYLHRRVLRSTELNDARFLRIVAGADASDTSADRPPPAAELSRVVITYGAE